MPRGTEPPVRTAHRMPADAAAAADEARAERRAARSTHARAADLFTMGPRRPRGRI